MFARQGEKKSRWFHSLGCLRERRKAVQMAERMIFLGAEALLVSGQGVGFCYHWEADSQIHWLLGDAGFAFSVEQEDQHSLVAAS